MLASANAFAQCDCDHIIGLSSTEYQFDGAKKGVKPGDKICFANGTRTGIGIFNVNGTPDNPVIITNMCDGQVTINAPSAWGNCVVVEQSSHFIFHGSGNPNIEYGINITGGQMGLNMQGRSTNFEVHHVSVNNVGCSGMLAKTDPTCDPGTWRGNFTLRDAYFHHNKISNTGCEGFYVGNSHYDSYVTKTCSGVSTQILEHDIVNVEIAYNELTNIGNDGIQVGASKQAKIHHNYLKGIGVKNNVFHQNSMQIGGGTEGALIYNNYMEDGRSYGVLDGGGGNYYYNNIIYTTVEGGFIFLHDVNFAPTGARIFNNTLINCKGYGFIMFSENPDATLFMNNIVVGQNQSNYVYFNFNNPAKNKLVQSNNILTQDITTVKFLNAAGKDFRLTASSPAVDGGKDVSTYGITFDYDLKPRPGGSVFDIGAFELQSVKPTANAGADKSITLPTNSLTLNGSGTSISGITSYSWVKKSGGNVTLTNETTANVSLADLEEGVYVFTLTVVDANGSASDDVTVTVLPEPPNQTPTANAGSDQIIILPDTEATIIGAGSDSDGSIQSYLWQKISGPEATLTGENQATLSLSALVEGTYEFQLTVTDDDGATGTDVVQISVLPAGSQPPVVTIADDLITIFTPISQATLSAVAADADGSIQSIVWVKQSGPTVTLANETTLDVSLTNLVLGTYVFRITVTDNTGLEAFDEITVEVLQGNQAPVANAGANKSITLPTSTIVLTGGGTDNDGTVASYLWAQVNGPSCTLANQTTSALTVSNMVQGTYTFGLTVTDDDGATGYDEVVVTVNSAPPNQSPSASAGADKTITLPQNSVILNGTATDSDGTIASTIWTKKSGPTATLTGANTLSVTVSNLVEGTYIFTLTVTDDDGATRQDDVTVTVLPATVNQPPIANAGANAFLTLPANSTTLNGIGSDADGTIATYAWTKVSGPSASISGASTATLQLTALVAGTYIFRLTVTDDDGATASDEVSIFVGTTNLAPIVTLGENITVIQPQASVILTSTAKDNDGSISTYLWTKQAGPTADLVNANTGTLTVNNLVVGTYTFRLTITDNSSATAFDEIIVSVISATTNQLPVVNIGNDRELFLPTSTVVIAGTATDPDGTITLFNWTQISGPGALLSNQTTNTLTALNLSAGTYVFRLTVTDNDAATAFDDITVIVHPSTTNQPPVVSAGINKIIQLPTNSLTLNGTSTDPDGTIASVNWIKVSGGNATLTNQATNNLALSGLVAGSYTFRITATDNAGASTTSDATVTVLPATVNQNPIASAGQNQLLTLPQNSTKLAGAGHDANGTIAGYLWTKVSGPAGGTITTPSAQITTISSLQEGAYVFRLTVTDNAGATGTDDVLVTVVSQSANKPPVANAGGNQTIFLPTNSINLFGSGFDADGSVATYQWTKLSGGTVTLTNANTKTVTLTNLQAGSYTFRLRVTDNAGATGDDVATIVVNSSATNVAPVAFAGADKVIKLPQNSITLAGSGSDIDGQITSFQWTQVSGSLATTGTTTASSLNVTNLTLGIYKFRLTVTDNQQASAFDDVVVQVVTSTSNLAPVISLGTDKNLILPTNQVTINATVTDDGSITSYLWTKLSGPTFNAVSMNVKDLQLQNLIEGTYTFQLTAVDNLGASTSRSIKVIVQPFVNSPPIVSAGDDIIITSPQNSTKLAGIVTEPDGQAFTVTWTKVSGGNATLINANTNTLTLQDLVQGTYVFKLEAKDASNATASDLVNVTVNPPPPNQVPLVTAGTNQNLLLPVTTTTLSGTADDPDGSVTGVTWSQNQGPNQSVINTAQNLTTTISGLIEGTYVFRLTATDNEGATGFSEVIVVVSSPGPDPNEKTPPVAYAGDDIVATMDMIPVSIAGHGVSTMPDTFIDGYLWEQTSGNPTELTISANVLLLSNLTGGSYTFKFTVRDSEDQTASDEVNVYVLDENDEIPKFFSPNNDGIGDTWSLRGDPLKYDGAKLVVISRTGQEVFKAEPYDNNWSGTYENGKPVPDGDYYYVLTLNTGKQIKGAVRIIR